MLYKSLIRGEFLEWFFKPFCKQFIGQLLGTIGSFITGEQKGATDRYLSDQQQQNKLQEIMSQKYGVAKRRQTALDTLLAGLDAGRSGQKRAADQYGRSMADFRQDTTGTPEQISKLQSLIRQQALPEQRRAMSQGRLALQQQGVRGPESALMQQMQANSMQESLSNRAQQVALQQQLRDRERRAQLAASQSAQALPGSIAGTTNYRPSL
jgi:hypothetical protein